MELNGESTYIEFDDDLSSIALHLPKGRESGALMELAAMLFFALKDEDCEDLLDEICDIVRARVEGGGQ